MSEWQRRWLLCGGIGSGKSEVRRLLSNLGVATIDADSVGHEVLEPTGPAFEQVAASWPETVVDGHIDRSRLATIVFDDVAQLRRLEEITHPHIFGTIERRLEEFDDPVVVEVPVLEHKFQTSWRRIVVDCDDETRLRRATKRGMSVESARSRMQAQPSRGEWLAVADIVVPNHGSLEELDPVVRLLESAL